MNPTAHPEQGPERGLGTGDALLAASTALGCCGLLLSLLMDLETPTATHGRLWRWSQEFGGALSVDAWVSSLVANLALGVFLLVLVWRTRTPPLRLADHKDWPTTTVLGVLLLLAGSVALSIYGLVAWLLVAILS